MICHICIKLEKRSKLAGLHVSWVMLHFYKCPLKIDAHTVILLVIDSINPLSGSGSDDELLNH